MRIRVLLSLSASAFLLAASASAGGLLPNPANHRSLLDKPIEDYAYEGATGCRKRVPPGMRAFEGWLGRNTPGESWGVMRCEKWDRGSFSLHSEGRAIDWRLDSGRPQERRSAMRLIRTLTMSDRNGEPNALARRMGVQGMIFDCRTWFGEVGELGRYSPCYKRNGELRDDLDRTQAHRDHVHLELNRDGARKRTSFWRSPVSRR